TTKSAVVWLVAGTVGLMLSTIGLPTTYGGPLTGNVPSSTLAARSVTPVLLIMFSAMVPLPVKLGVTVQVADDPSGSGASGVTTTAPASLADPKLVNPKFAGLRPLTFSLKVTVQVSGPLGTGGGLDGGMVAIDTTVGRVWSMVIDGGYWAPV